MAQIHTFTNLINVLLVQIAQKKISNEALIFILFLCTIQSNFR